VDGPSTNLVLMHPWLIPLGTVLSLLMVSAVCNLNILPVSCNECTSRHPGAGCTADPNIGAKFIRDLYEASEDTNHKYTVPVLWDKRTNRIVNNESSEIIRMFTKVQYAFLPLVSMVVRTYLLVPQEFNQWATGPMAELDLYPEAIHDKIKAVNDWVYPNINDGVYRCGFAKSQEAYDEAVNSLFEALERADLILSCSRYLVGDSLTEADIRLFMTLVRFDEVYVVYFKCNVKSIMDYPNLRNYCRDIYQLPGMAECISMQHIKTHYYT
jgi:putative glutathione S-transferase